MDAFTGNEILRFFARLRGVPEDKVRVLVDSAAFVADVGDDGLQLCETYSSGTRRKLSTAVAVIGCPRVVILDDATGGVDLVGREMIYETLQDITRVGASGVLFTSRSTEECKMACHRVGIMAGGELKALGTMEQLKDTFARGCTISFRIYEKFTGYVGTAVDKGVQKLFPGARQAECRENSLGVLRCKAVPLSLFLCGEDFGGAMSQQDGVFLYYIDYRLPWSRVFSRINKLRRWFVVESVLVSESSLDEVLLGMARAEQAEDSAEAQLAAKDASRDLYEGDPWGREEQHKYERRQRLREKRRRRDSPTQASEPETHTRHGTGSKVEV
ncbi:phospholipid-transporting ATPase ABCA3-like [Dermacentor variabilis]|uniref:phospholipid-transporting ATPase ABCA3-like n=1 Tax=Dermacentor variabilis TaxID=34621 RepID=UPI003F5BAEA4